MAHLLLVRKYGIFTFMSVSIMNYNIPIFSALQTDAPVFVHILSALTETTDIKVKNAGNTFVIASGFGSSTGKSHSLNLLVVTFYAGLNMTTIFQLLE